MDNKSPRRGRPATNPLDRLRTKMWFLAILKKSNLPTAYAIELFLDGDRVRKRKGDVARPRRWDAYREGVKVPRDEVGNKRNAIEQAEEKFPGTAKWFRSPLWDFLRGESFDRYRIDEALRQLEPDVVGVLFEDTPREHETTPRSRPIDTDSIYKLIELSSFDSLVAAVLLIALSDAIASPDLRKLALEAYTELQRPLLMIPDFTDCYAELFPLIDARCKHWVYLSPNQRLEVFIPYEGVQDYLKNKDTFFVSDSGLTSSEVMKQYQESGKGFYVYGSDTGEDGYHSPDTEEPKK